MNPHRPKIPMATASDIPKAPQRVQSSLPHPEPGPRVTPGAEPSRATGCPGVKAYEATAPTHAELVETIQALLVSKGKHYHESVRDLLERLPEVRAARSILERSAAAEGAPAQGPRGEFETSPVLTEALRTAVKSMECLISAIQGIHATTLDDTSAAHKLSLRELPNLQKVRMGLRLAEATQVPSPTSEPEIAAARVRHFLDEWRASGARSMEVIYGLHAGVEGRETELLIADLDALVHSACERPRHEEAPMGACADPMASGKVEYRMPTAQEFGRVLRPLTEGFMHRSLELQKLSGDPNWNYMKSSAFKDANALVARFDRARLLESADPVLLDSAHKLMEGQPGSDFEQCVLWALEDRLEAEVDSRDAQRREQDHS